MRDPPGDPALVSPMVAPPTLTVTGAARVTCVVGLVGEQPEPELSFGVRVDPQGVSEVHAGARGALAIMAMARVLIVLFIVAGAVVIGMLLRTPREDPRRRYPCTERIERSEHIERTCARDG